MIKNANMKDAILNNTKRKKTKYFCHFFKGVEELHIQKYSKTEPVTLKSLMDLKKTNRFFKGLLKDTNKN